MKYYKFKKITKGENPIIRITYKTWYGSLIEKDICKSKDIEGFWKFMEDGSLTHRFDPINNFYKNDEDVYWVNSA
tara:strand:- start:367 stop:591 length:225 start_codon:yes stop_codon:yes gene_type:complete